MTDIPNTVAPAADVVTMATTVPSAVSSSTPAFEQSVHDDVDSAIAAIPPGKNNALFVDGRYDRTNGPGLQAVWVHRVGDDWKVAVSGAYDGPHGLMGKVQSVLAW